jgi:ferric-dicitrate binding protein FerR (iron transport regulator)
MEIPGTITDIIEKTLRQEENDLERRQLDAWLRECPEHRAAYRKFVKAHDLASYTLKWGEIDMESAWKNVEERYRRACRRRRARVGFSVAASLLVLLGIAFLLFPASPVEPAAPVSVIPPGEFKAILKLSDGRQLVLNKEVDLSIDDAGFQVNNTPGSLNYVAGSREGQGEKLFHEVSTPVGGEFHLTLSDGTHVYLNAASRLRFPVRFSPGAPREVTLEGEAYFDVKHDPSSPFITRAREMEVRVLGTDFNVMAYEDDARVEVTLVHGEVNVRTGGEERLLAPSEQLVMDYRTGECTVRHVDKTAAYVNWKNGVLDFDAMPLDELTVKLRRWYSVDFFFANERLKELQFTGAVKKYENIDYILGLIGATTDVAFEINGNVITVTDK